MRAGGAPPPSPCAFAGGRRRGVPAEGRGFGCGRAGGLRRHASDAAGALRRAYVGLRHRAGAKVLPWPLNVLE